jgi:putative transposase
MTEKITSVSSMPKKVKKTTSRSEAEQAAVRELVKAARARGEDLTGPDGLLKSITATVLETALEEELTEHLGHEKHQVPTAENGNIRDGTRPKTVLTDAAGEVTIAVPRDRAGTFEPVIVKKRQRRLSDVDAVAISLFAKGLTTGEISAHFHEVYGAVGQQGHGLRITDKVLEEMAACPPARWTRCTRPSSSTRSYVKVRDGQVATNPFYAAIGVDLNGERDILGSGPGTGRWESAKFWMNVLTDLRNRGVQGRVLRRLRRPQRTARQRERRLPPGDRADLHHPPDPQHCATPPGTGTSWPRTCADLHRPTSTAAAIGGVRGSGREVGQALPGHDQAVDSAWEEFIPFLDYDVEIRTVHVLHQRDRVPQRPVPAGGHRPAATSPTSRPP